MSGRGKLLANSLSLLTNRLGQSLSALVVVTLVARMLGAHALGQYMLAFSFYFVVMTIVAQGFKTLFTREMAKDATRAGDYLVSGSVLQLGCALIGYLALVALVSALPYSAETSAICVLFGVMLIPYALSNVTESVFQAFDKMHFIAISTAPVYLLRVLAVWLALRSGAGLQRVCEIMIASEVVVLLVEWLFVMRLVKPARRIDTAFIRRVVAQARTLVAIEGMSVVRSRSQMFILSLLGGEVVVGLYGGIMQLLQPFLIASHSLVAGVFPSMAKASALGPDRQRQLTARIIETLLMVSIPFIIALMWVGAKLMVLIYDDAAFAAAAIPLVIVGIGTVASSFNRAQSFLLVANGHEDVNLREVIVSTFVGGALTIWLVQHYGLLGAAISGPIIGLAACLQYSHAVHTRLFTMSYLPLIGRPLLVGAAMFALFMLLDSLHTGLWATLAITGLTYGAILVWFLRWGTARPGPTNALPVVGKPEEA